MKKLKLSKENVYIYSIMAAAALVIVLVLVSVNGQVKDISTIKIKENIQYEVNARKEELGKDTKKELIIQTVDEEDIEKVKDINVEIDKVKDSKQGIITYIEDDKDIELKFMYSVSDTVAPKIELLKESVAIGEVKDINKLIKVTDNSTTKELDEKLVEIKSNFKSDEIGEYQITVKAKDDSGNISEEEFSIKVLSKEDIEKLAVEEVEDVEVEKEESSKDLEDKTSSSDKETTKPKEPSKEKPSKEDKTPATAPSDKEETKYLWEEVKFGEVGTDVSYDANMDKGKENTTPGYQGTKKVQVKVVLRNGKEISREKTGKEEVVNNPVNTKVVKGSKEAITAGTDHSQTAQLKIDINAARAEKGLHPYTFSSDMMEYARIRSTEPFSHTRPNGQGVSSLDPKILGEALSNYSTVSDTISGWKSSPSHARILYSEADNFAGVASYQRSDGEYHHVLLTSAR